MKVFSKEIIQWAERIGQFYLEKNGGDYDKTESEIRHLNIQNLEVDDKLQHSKKLIIHTTRPGLLIGKRGENVELLEKYLGIKIHIEEVNSITDLIVPYNYDEDLKRDAEWLARECVW